jgi:hypothetical protein
MSTQKTNAVNHVASMPVSSKTQGVIKKCITSP